MTEQNKIPAAPKGYQSRTEDVVGFVEPEKAPVHIIPRSAKSFDNTIKAERASTLIFCQLVEAAELTDKDGQTVLGKPGDMVGLWAKPGMRDIAECCGVKTFVQFDGEKDLGRKGQSPMKKFLVSTENDMRKPIPHTDFRNKSRDAWTIFSTRAPRRDEQDGDASGAEPPF